MNELVSRYLITRQEFGGIVYPGDTTPGWYNIPKELSEQLGFTEDAISVEPASAPPTVAPRINTEQLELAAREMLDASAQKQIYIQTEGERLAPSQPPPQTIVPVIQAQVSPSAPEIQANMAEMVDTIYATSSPEREGISPESLNPTEGAPNPEADDSGLE